MCDHLDKCYLAAFSFDAVCFLVYFTSYWNLRIVVNIVVLERKR